MSKSPEKVDVTLSHNQELEGKPRKAGDSVTVDARRARVLVSRGSAQLKTKAAAKAVSGSTAAKAADKDGK